MASFAERIASEELWVLFRRVVPETAVTRPQGGGRRRAGDHECLAAITFVTTSGCSWRQLPPVFGPAWPTVYRRFAQWSKERVWTRLHRVTGDQFGQHLDLPWREPAALPRVRGGVGRGGLFGRRASSGDGRGEGQGQEGDDGARRIG
ncbi:transposase, partial [Streptomyces sp. NPDC001739]